MQEKLGFYELEIFNNLLKCVSPKEMAYKLNVSNHTIAYHRTKLYRKLKVKNAKELLAKYGSSGSPVSFISEEKPFVITLHDDAPHGHSFRFYPFNNSNVMINSGDLFTVNYSFSSNIDLDVLQIDFVDLTERNGIFFAMLSPNVPLKNIVKADTLYSGSVTIFITKTANNAEPNANLLNIQSLFSTPQPTITFTKLEVIKN
ncbi:MAG: helix-turn-helix transcriptional regulator [Treponema sp.]|nr:helix-turn-helix transcriptional regulator [Treponema sp.]